MLCPFRNSCFKPMSVRPHPCCCTVPWASWRPFQGCHGGHTLLAGVVLAVGSPWLGGCSPAVHGLVLRWLKSPSLGPQPHSWDLQAFWQGRGWPAHLDSYPFPSSLLSSALWARRLASQPPATWLRLWCWSWSAASFSQLLAWASISLRMPSVCPHTFFSGCCEISNRCWNACFGSAEVGHHLRRMLGLEDPQVLLTLPRVYQIHQVNSVVSFWNPWPKNIGLCAASELFATEELWGFFD